MEITQELRRYALERGIEVGEAVEVGLEEKAREYRRERLAAEGARVAAP
jgi:hypothetical protein